MSPVQSRHRQLMDRAIHAAQLAGARIMTHYGKDLEVLSKDIGTHGGDCVTQADHDAQDIIFRELFQHLDSDPLLSDCAVLSEEMDDYQQSKRFEKDYTFLIDPLDGTRGFIDHNNSFGVSIGLVERDHTPVFGVVLLPATGKLFTGFHQSEAHLNGTALTPVADGATELVLYVSEAEIFPAANNRLWHQLCDGIKARTSITKIRPCVIGSPVHKGCLTAESRKPALYLGLPRSAKGVSLWDMAAIAAIVSGAGGHVSDVHGQQLELNRRGSTYVHHQGFLMCNAPHIAQAAIAAFADL